MNIITNCSFVFNTQVVFLIFLIKFDDVVDALETYSLTERNDLKITSKYGLIHSSIYKTEIMLT